MLVSNQTYPNKKCLVFTKNGENAEKYVTFCRLSTGLEGERAHLPLSRSEGLRHGFYIGRTGSVAEIGDRGGEGGRDRQERLLEFLIGP